MIRQAKATTSSSSRRDLRVGAVQYLNTKPLVHGLAGGGLDVIYDLPSRLADQRGEGRVRWRLTRSARATPCCTHWRVWATSCEPLPCWAVVVA